MNQRNPRKILLIAGGMVLAFIVLSILAVIFRPETVDRKAAELLPVDTPATIVNGTDLYNLIGGYNRYKNLRIDLAGVSKNFLKQEGTPSFTVTTANIDTSGYLYVDGYLKDKSSSIIMNIELLENERMKITASYGSKKEDVSSYFKSNSPLNSLAATLPKDTRDYTIGFEPSTELFSITVYDTTESTLTAGKADLAEMLGEEYSDEIYTIIYPTFLGGADSTEQEIVGDQEGLD